ncbi:hypothetical protein HWB57_gp050 [Erwinia phage vB_EamM-Bue1]|uniref:Uncharacterized protein n=1 Tax=Erwinia phage vB_EamM-Bue1 TaxID=2099338 RepID=A0A2P1JU58_9CAUD|nr:hypothetical protein HWB57_gp050 [Erwinia phage vB_EamM-Bue1]AVO22890.1 hypothetical protein [Erwinia phage vB_EamM-Bue1]
MSYILHADSGKKFDITGKTAEQVKDEIKAAGLTIGNVTVARLVDGSMKQANGFEVIESLSEDEREEQDRLLQEAKTGVDIKANEDQVAQQPADANQTTYPGVVTAGENAENADAALVAPADTIQEVAPNLPNPTDAPHTEEPSELPVSNITSEGQVRSPESSITEPAGEPILTVSKEPHTESTLTQPTNADGTVAAPDVAATDVNDVNAPAPETQLGSNLETDLNLNNAAAEQNTNVEQTVTDATLEATDVDGKVQDGAVAHGLNSTINADASLEGVDPTQTNEVAKDPAIEKRTESSQSSTVDADEVRRRMLGKNVADALKERENVDGKDDVAVAAADKKLKDKSLTPSAADVDRKRRHNKREDTIEVARSGKHGDDIRSIEAGVTPGLTLNYVNPDERWFEFAVTDKIDAAKPHSRTNTYVDLAPLKEGGYNFGLYVNGKSMKSTIKRVRVAKDEDVVKALNEWLPEALKQAGV